MELCSITSTMSESKQRISIKRLPLDGVVVQYKLKAQYTRWCCCSLDFLISQHSPKQAVGHPVFAQY